MYYLIDQFIADNNHARGSFYMTELLREFVRVQGFDYFDACDYIVNSWGYSL